jgi:hypothetical protein
MQAKTAQKQTKTPKVGKSIPTKQPEKQVIRVQLKNHEIIHALASVMARNGYRFSKTNALVFLERVKDQVKPDIYQQYSTAVKMLP